MGAIAPMALQFGLGTALSGMPLFAGMGWMGKALAGGLAGGLVSSMTGGKFGKGFLMGGLGGAFQGLGGFKGIGNSLSSTFGGGGGAAASPSSMFSDFSGMTSPSFTASPGGALLNPSFAISPSGLGGTFASGLSNSFSGGTLTGPDGFQSLISPEAMADEPIFGDSPSGFGVSDVSMVDQALFEPSSQGNATAASSSSGGNIIDILTGGGPGLLGQLADVGMTLYGQKQKEDLVDKYVSSQEQQQEKNIAFHREAAEATDPWGWTGKRGAATDELLALMNNPDSVRNLPGYEFGLGEAKRETDRQMRRGGYSNSGNLAVALQDRAQGYADMQYDKEFNRLSTLAGVNNTYAKAYQGTSPEASAVNAQLGILDDAFTGLGYSATDKDEMERYT